ncbi:EamA family transporter [Mesorhizobium sp.]|uniref:DMT family transporter n=1 Tax=Mesorhizobium sp. TaxID=1871066 RepID=UPI000FE98B08|nr:EamA family transporter [Mesorhizobium sp.]RWG06079.1 MAG: hypothetical protein EOQ54_08735 [Mesorhizobium sp.]RWG97571.1 MAG: hypothetical protein EOQ72_18720 [Mesorhizobium sp.]TIN47751.1 MAG: hypothetical protein E5Y25_04655 [Mesorhizobium sp.]TIR91109.1 MAG: hypothetical protein E5X08_20405 [Mesorhizobium sp.]TIS04326.1 MAG: hypothetical protein E5X13_01945 [Mesorhizobium sp.]
MDSASTGASDGVSPLAHVLLAAVSVWWAGSYLLIKIAVLNVPPATLAASRLLIASAVLLAWLRTGNAGSLPSDATSWARYAQIALFGHAVPLYLIAWASMIVPVGEMAILVATTPLFAVLFAHLSRHELPSRETILGLSVGLIGLVALLSRAEMSPLRFSSAAPLIALLGAAASYALSARAVARLQDTNALLTGTAVMTCAIPMLLVPSLLFERPWAITPSAWAVAAILLLGVMSTAVVYVAYYRLIKMSGPAFASMHHYLVPALSAVLSSVALNEKLDLVELMLMTPILASIFIARRLASQKL